MTYKEAYNQTRKWQKKASLISMFHHKMKLKQMKWKIRDTAKYFEISVGKVSEDIKIVLKSEYINGCKTRAEALIILRSLK